MRLLRDQIGAFKEDLQLQTSAVKLLINISSVAGFSEAAFNAMQISVSVFNKNSGEEPVLPKMPLRDAFNKSSFKEGFFKWGQNTLSGTIDLSVHGAVDMEEGEYFSINYEGFPADALTSIYAVDAPMLVKSVLKTEEITISGTTKDINVSDKSSLFIPLTDGAGHGVESLQLQYANRTVTYTEDEIKLLNESVNDLACVIDQTLDNADGTSRLVKFGYDRLLHLDITNVIRLQIKPKTKTAISVYTEHSIGI